MSHADLPRKEAAPGIALPGRAVLARKRLFDVVCAAAGLLLFSPLLVFTALLVGLTSPGGFLFCQERIGRGGHPFLIYKFRTMYKDCAGLKITAGTDSRITKVGGFLRAAKIDELPQLLNVLRGEMSLVGPRPEVPEYTALYTGEQKQVLLLRPGITGPASVAFRNESALLAASDDPNRLYVEEIMPRKLAMDREYLSRACVRTDLKILFQTAAALAGERGKTRAKGKKQNKGQGEGEKF